MKIKLSILISVVCFLLTSCKSNEDNEAGKTSYGKVEVAFSVNLPQPEPVHVYTRTGTPYTDTDIKNMDVLVFDKDGKFMNRYKVETADLGTIVGGVSFSVRLDATPDRRIIHLVANGRTPDGMTDRLNFASLVPGASELAAISSLQTASLSTVNTGAGTLLANVMPLVMWGRSVLNGISVVTKAEGVKLLRAAACVQVRKGSAQAGNGLSDLTLEGITVHNGACHGFLAPADCTGDVVTPSIAHPATDGPYLDFQKGWSNGTEPTLYIYERNCTKTDYMSVILSAQYKGQLGYYKIVMTDAQGTPVNIVRNHRYGVTIIQVNGPGYADVQTAVTSAPSNSLKVELTDEDVDFPILVADGQYLMGLSNNSFDLYGAATETADMVTVFSSRGVQPVVRIPTDCTWLQTSVTSLGGNKYKITGIFSPVVTPVQTTLTLVCDNLSQEVRVGWNPSISNMKNTNSFVIDLLHTEDRNWEIKIFSPRDLSKAILHSTLSTPGALPGAISGGVFELTSKYSSHAYLHVRNYGAEYPNTHSTAGRSMDLVQLRMTASNSGLTSSRRIVIAQFIEPLTN